MGIRVTPRPPQLPTKQQVSRLTLTERRVLEMIGLLYTNTEIAAVFARSQSTIEEHIKALYRKLGTRDRAHLAVTAIAHGLAHQPDPD